MKKLTLATTALYLALASSAFADSNSLIITQASVGAGAPSINFTQSNSGAAASIIQNGANVLTGVQLGLGGTKLNVDQENPTSGAANTIGYTGRGNSDVTIDQRASNGIFTASGSAGNTASVDVAGNIAGNPANKLFLDQVGYNNSAIVHGIFTGYAPAPQWNDNIQLAQYSNNAAAGNQLQVISNPGAGAATFVSQTNGNKANIAINGGQQNIALNQINTGDNIALANVANLAIAGAGFNWTQTGTSNDIEASLNGNAALNQGLIGFQSGDHNLATVTQNTSYQDPATGANIVDQTGTGNIATATQTATHNSTFSIIQNGTANNALINQGGISNSALIQQTGNGNQGTINQTGTSNVAQIIQASNNNVASITQSGTGMTTIIHQ